MELSVIAQKLLVELEKNEKDEFQTLIEKIKIFCEHVRSGKFSGVANAELGECLLLLCLRQQKEIENLKAVVAKLKREVML